MQTIEKQQWVEQQRARHHRALELLGAPDGLKAWRKLRQLERRGHAFGLRLCNGPEMSEADQDRETAEITAKVSEIFGGKLPKGFFVNRDPRGCAIKLDEDCSPVGLHQDFGGFGCLAAEIT